jgi:hypothetical protein
VRWRLAGTVDSARTLTCTIFASRLGAFWLQVPDYFTFTFVAEPLTTLALGLQVALLMDMFDAPTPHKLDYVGQIESLALGWNQTFQGYLRYNLKRGARVDPVSFKPTPEKAAFIKPQSKKSELWQALHDEPQLLCDVAHMLQFDFECLPEYDVSQWCTSPHH